MKKILVFLCLLLMLSGCAKTEKPPADLPDDPIDVSGEKTVLYHGDKDFPLSFTIDGQQQIQNGTYWYYELSDLYDRSWEDSFYSYDVKSLDLNGMKNYGSFGKKDCYATNGDWPLFLVPVHSEFSASNQDKIESRIIKAVDQQLKAHQMEKTAPVVTDTWLCDLDGDGAQEMLFKAEDSRAGTYRFLGYLQEENCQVLEGWFDEKNEDDLPDITPIVCDMEGDRKWSVMLHKTGDYESFTLYDFNNGNFTQGYTIIF